MSIPFLVNTSGCGMMCGDVLTACSWSSLASWTCLVAGELLEVAWAAVRHIKLRRESRAVALIESTLGALGAFPLFCRCIAAHILPWLLLDGWDPCLLVSGLSMQGVMVCSSMIYWTDVVGLLLEKIGWIRVSLVSICLVW